MSHPISLLHKYICMVEHQKSSLIYIATSGTHRLDEIAKEFLDVLPMPAVELVLFKVGVELLGNRC